MTVENVNKAGAIITINIYAPILVLSHCLNQVCVVLSCDRKAHYGSVASLIY